MSGTNVRLSKTFEATADALFDLLAQPDRHAELDGSDMVVSAAHGARLSEIGQKFTMNMHWDHLGGDYQTDNYVNELVPNRRLGWLTADAGAEPAGWAWLWEFEPNPQGGSEVTLTYDWSQVTDPEVLSRVEFPVVSRAQLKESMDNLAAAVN